MGLPWCEMEPWLDREGLTLSYIEELILYVERGLVGQLDYDQNLPWVPFLWLIEKLVIFLNLPLV